MKSVAVERPRSSVLGVKKDHKSCIMKNNSGHGIEFRGEKFTLSEEMKELFVQLSTMVPDVPRNEAGNIDGTVLMQYVIDYILDLELQLGGALTSSLASRLQECREPLSEKTIHNIVHTQNKRSSCDFCLSTA